MSADAMRRNARKHLFVMTRFKTIVVLFWLLVGTVAATAAEPKHDLYLAAAINRNYVVGSKLVTVSGLFKRVADGAYAHLGLNFLYIFNVAVDPRDAGAFYLASLNGVLVSKDGGLNWRIGTSWDATEAKDVCVDRNAPDTVYLALPDGVMVSVDRGATWQRRESGLPERGKYTQAVEVDRTKAGRVFAGCESGIYVTDNGARTWRRLFASQTTITDIQQSPHYPKLWLATSQNDGVLVSRDGGMSWKKFAEVPSAEAHYNVAFDATNPRRFAISSWSYGVTVSEDGGTTFTQRNDGLPEGHRAFRVGIDPDSGRLLAGIYQEALYVSDDFGRTWRKEGLEGSTIHNFAFIPRAGK